MNAVSVSNDCYFNSYFLLYFYLCLLKKNSFIQLFEFDNVFTFIYVKEDPHKRVHFLDFIYECSVSVCSVTAQGYVKVVREKHV